MALKGNELIEKIKRTNRIDLKDINDVTEIGMAIEAMNDEIVKRAEKDADYATNSISKFLERIETSKTFFGGNKK